MLLLRIIISYDASCNKVQGCDATAAEKRKHAGNNKISLFDLHNFNCHV